MDIDQQRAVLTLCLMAAFADGAHSDQERAEIKRIAGALGADSALDAAAIYEDVLLNKPDMRAVAAAITQPEQRQFAYEMAVGVCNADGATTPAERSFLDELAAALNVDKGSAQQFAQERERWRCRSLRGRRSTVRSSPRSRPTPPRSTRRSSTTRSSTARWSCCRNRWRRWRSFRCR